MLTPLVLASYFVGSFAIVVSVRLLRRSGGQSIIAAMTLLFVIQHMVGIYWVPDEISLYGSFDETVFNTMLGFQMSAALILVGGCLVQHRITVPRFQKVKGLVLYTVVLFLLSLMLTSLPVSVLMAGAFLVLRLGGQPIDEDVREQRAPDAAMAALIRSPLSAIVIVLCAGLLVYELVFAGGLEDVRLTLQYGFSSLSDYFRYRVRSDFTPSFWASQLGTVKTSIAPVLSLLMLSAALCKRSFILLGLFCVFGGLVALMRLESFAKSALAVYTIQVAITFAALVLAGHASRRRIAGLAFSAGLRLFVGLGVSAAILGWMYSFTNYSESFTDTVLQISRRFFLTPSQSAYAWFYVFPDHMDFVGFSRSRILAAVFDVPYSVTGYLPYTVSALATGYVFGLNANFVATGWAYFGVWGLAVTLQLVVGTLCVERWLRAIADPYIYWPAYAFVYGSLIIAVTVAFDGVVISYGVWIVPIIFCIMAKTFTLSERR